MKRRFPLETESEPNALVCTSCQWSRSQPNYTDWREGDQSTNREEAQHKLYSLLLLLISYYYSVFGQTLHPLQQGITPTRTFQMKVLVKWSTFISCQDLATVATASHKLSQSCDESNCECKNVIPSRISSVNISQMIIIIFTINKRLLATHCLVALTDWSV